MELIKPPIFPKITPEESPVGFLKRVARENFYPSHNWLIEDCSSTRKSTLYFKKLVERAHWIEKKEFPLLNLKESYLLNHARICPLCIKEASIWLEKWHVKLNTICTKHKIWLIDSCQDCGKLLRFDGTALSACDCGARFESYTTARVSHEQLGIQKYLEGYFIEERANILGEPAELSYERRVDFLYFLAKKQPSCIDRIKGGHTNLDRMNTAQIVVSELADNFLCGRISFYLFLDDLKGFHFVSEGSTSDKLVSFYRSIYRDFKHDCPPRFRAVFEDYINSHWIRALNGRNSLLSKYVKDRHPWIPIDKACEIFSIDKSKLKLAISEGDIQEEIRVTKSRRFSLVNKYEVEELKAKIDDLVDATEARLILGVTKKQFDLLISNEIIHHKSRPCCDKLGSWRISKRHLLQFLDSLNLKEPQSDIEVLSFNRVLKKYGSVIPDLFKRLLILIQTMRIKAFAENQNLKLRDIQIEKQSFLDWHEAYKDSLDRYSIPEIALKLGIQQEFAYQLTKGGVLKTFRDSCGYRYICSEQLTTFKENYALLSKLSKSENTSSKAMFEKLKQYGVYPIDELSRSKFRQKVYSRSDLVKCNEYSECVNTMRDWAYA